MRDNDAQAETIGQYLLALLLTCWREGGSFSPKRPFGSSDWRTDVWAALGDAGHITCVFDADGYIEDCDDEAADTLIEEALAALTGHCTPGSDLDDTVICRVDVIDVADTARRIFGGEQGAADVCGRPVPEHGYRFNIRYGNGGEVNFNVGATATHVADWWLNRKDS